MRVKYFLRACTVILLTVIIFSCSKSEDFPPNGTEYAFLDVDVTNAVNFTENDHRILEEAKSRFENYVNYQTDRFVVSVKTGSEIAISDRLFEALVGSISILNKQLASGEVMYYEGKLYSTTNSLQTRSYDWDDKNDEPETEKPETTSERGMYSYTETTSMSQDQAFDYYKSFNNSGSSSSLAVAAGFAGLGVDGYLLYTAQNVTGIGIAGMAYDIMVLADQAARNGAGNRIFDAARQGGITITDRLDFTTGSMSSTITDSNGDHVATWVYGSTGWF